MSFKRHVKFLNRAKKEAQKSVHQQQIGCVLSKGSKIISTGYNQIRYKSKGQRFTNYQESLHAERDCISKVDKDELKSCTLYVWREGKHHPMLAKPCDNCFGMIQFMGIKKIVYTTNEFPYFQVVKL